MTNKVVILSSITSDIGLYLAKRFKKEGWIIIGTYRSKESLNLVKKISDHIFYNDLFDVESTSLFLDNFRKIGLKWDLFISCVGSQKPIGAFFKSDFDEWSKSVHINAIEQLRIFHGIHSSRNQQGKPTAIFFAGGGTNNAISNYSAYTVSKILLIKMCELIDFENKDLNVSIIGPGWTKTKMHYETLEVKREIVGDNYKKTIQFIEDGVGTPLEDIFECIEFIYQKGKVVTGGRNFSVVHDKWRKGENEELIKILKTDFNIYKLRREGNNFKS